MQKLQFIIEPDYEEERIDKFITSQCEGLSRSHVQKLIKENEISVNGAPIKSNYRLCQGDILEVHIPELTMPDILPENIPLDILYEDSDLLIINKPKGMVVHPCAGHYTGTLVNAVMYYCKGELSGINGVMRPGIVHRIDKDTTGSIMVCKNDMAHQSLATQLKDHSIKRVYHAIVQGVVKEDHGTVDAPIGRHPNDRKKMSVVYKNGKEAITHYEVLKRYRKFTYISCQLETGRTHQIRVHMASIHHPLLGDVIYGPEKCSISSLQGQTLHAKTLGILHPRTGVYLEVDAPLPEYFNSLLDTFDRQL